MPNALSNESSPYLLQHANNPVDWLPWSDDAFARAARENKPVFLSIGYSTCHWCHVMEHESFENKQTAALMNEFFINIKVDREEMPAIDALYMTFVQASTGHGGWPMSLWLTPAAEPILGGTYFPPEDRHGRAGFPRICREVARLWREDPRKMCDNASRMLHQLQAEAASKPDTMSSIDEQVVGDFLHICGSQFDAAFGGFGNAPKFPRPSVLRTLMQFMDHPSLGHEGSRKAWEMVEGTLTAMIRGGIHDQLGGGFHRYSVDRRWHIPHYEKMLYDQAQIADVCLDAWQISGKALYKEAAEGVFRYLIETMQDPGGAFHAAEDADSQPDESSVTKREGAFWTWAADEISALLDPRTALIFSIAYGIEAGGNAAPESDPHQELSGQNTLHRAFSDQELAKKFDTNAEEIDTTLAAARKVLLETRSRRPAPHRDDKIIAAWNGLCISSLVRGARILNRPELAEAAEAAMAFIKNHLWDGKTLSRSYRGKKSRSTAGPSDYACLIDALIELNGLFPDNGNMEFALELQRQMDQQFWSETQQGYVMRPQMAGRELLSIREDHDGAESSPNHIAAWNLLKLSTLQANGDFLARAETLLRHGSTQLMLYPYSTPVLLGAWDCHHRGIVKWDFQGKVDAKVSTKIYQRYQPRSIFVCSSGNGEVIVCEGVTCRPHEDIHSADRWPQGPP